MTKLVWNTSTDQYWSYATYMRRNLTWGTPIEMCWYYINMAVTGLNNHCLRNKLHLQNVLWMWFCYIFVLITIPTCLLWWQFSIKLNVRYVFLKYARNILYIYITHMDFVISYMAYDIPDSLYIYISQIVYYIISIYMCCNNDWPSMTVTARV